MLLRGKFALILLVFAAFLIGHKSISAQTQKFALTYNAPTRLGLNSDAKGDEESPDKLLLLEKFYPIGWSKDGKFAYYTEPADEACGCYFAELIIQDLRTDKILWQKKYNSENGGADDLPKYWTKNQKEFSRKLAQYGIKTEKNFTLLTVPIVYQMDTLTPDIKVDLKIDNEDSVKGNILLRLMSKGKGSKTIYEKIYRKGFDSIRGAEIGGILQSPYEPRAAIILVETLRGYEGPPNITSIKIVGATLNGGFK